MWNDALNVALDVLSYVTVGTIGAGFGSALTIRHYKRKGLL